MTDWRYTPLKVETKELLKHRVEVWLYDRPDLELYDVVEFVRRIDGLKTKVTRPRQLSRDTALEEIQELIECITRAPGHEVSVFDLLVTSQEVHEALLPLMPRIQPRC